MAMNVGNTGNGKRRRLVSEINVTPMVDVMLVLLVIFMIAAPSLKDGFAVAMPEADATQAIGIEDTQLITVTADGHVLRDRAKSEDDRYEKLADLVTDLRTYRERMARNGQDAVVVIAGDRNTRYERIIQVWNAARNAGISRVSFQLEPGQGTP